LVLRNLTTNSVYALPANVDPRFWTPGVTSTVNTSVTVPSTVPPGSYQLLLNLPDPEPTLHDRPEYSIRLANIGLWEPSTGYNNLQTTVTVENATLPAAVVVAPPVVTGAAVTLRWSAGDPRADYILEAGSAPGLANLYNASIGNLTSLTAMVPSGTYYIRIRVRAGGLVGPASSKVSFTVGGSTSPPPPPNGVSGRISNGVATVAWNAVPGATSYIVQAGPAPGSSTFFNGDVGPATSVSSPVAPGFRGYVRVAATNACGRGPVSQEIVVE
jgi:hypothetical protein